MEGDHIVGFGFLKNAAIDQHLLRRNRQFDLVPVIEAHPELLGIGIDEGTAILVRGNQFEVLGASYVAVYDAKQWAANPARKGQFRLLGRGEAFDLKQRRPVSARFRGDR
jgi:cyanophycinase